MTGWQTRRLKVAATWVGFAVLALLIGAALFATSGLYSVAASKGHFGFTSWLLEFSMRRSVATHSVLITPPRLDDPDMVTLGAGHFQGGCAPCHGSPSEGSSPIVDRMLPPPPRLSHAVTTWSDAELFWIVKNGIKYTGMPSWVSLARDDEVWAMVAFLRALPQIGPDEYRRLVRASGGKKNRSAAEITSAGTGTMAISACGRCHGDESTTPASRLVPVLAGQSAGYLEMALRQYAQGSRQSGVMQPAAAELDDAAITALATYYARLAPVRRMPATPSAEQIQRGQEIATLGIPAKGVPPCLSCHAGAVATFPTLAGQHARYIVTQLQLWQRGLRAATAHGAIMAPVAKRLTAQQIEDVAAYFDSLANRPVDQVSGRGDTGPAQ